MTMDSAPRLPVWALLLTSVVANGSPALSLTVKGIGFGTSVSATVGGLAAGSYTLLTDVPLADGSEMLFSSQHPLIVTVAAGGPQ